MLHVGTKNVGFAFLRYADADTSLRAIAGEVRRSLKHLIEHHPLMRYFICQYEKIYDGRMSQVQIREVKPPLVTFHR